MILIITVGCSQYSSFDDCFVNEMSKMPEGLSPNWVGNSKNNYKGTIGKLKECFKDFNKPLRLIVFQIQCSPRLVSTKCLLAVFWQFF